MKRIEITEENSSLISFVEYEKIKDVNNVDLTIGFRKYYIDQITFIDVPIIVLIDLISSQSLGKYYLTYIKNHFSQKNTNKMADKVIKIKIDVNKINKEWLFVGDKGVYLNLTLLYNEQSDQYGNCGLVTQDVPSKIYKEEKERKIPKDRMKRGEILGNGREFSKTVSSEETQPGKESGKMATDHDFDDLPF